MFLYYVHVPHIKNHYSNDGWPHSKIRIMSDAAYNSDLKRQFELLKASKIYVIIIWCTKYMAWTQLGGHCKSKHDKQAQN